MVLKLNKDNNMKIISFLLVALFFLGCGGGGGSSSTEMEIGKVYNVNPGDTIVPNEENSIVLMQRAQDGLTTAELTQGSATLSQN
jgi:hypothetical protein